MTILTGNAALASDVAAINTLATSASTAASVATANAASALANSIAAQATAAQAEAAAAIALSVPALAVVTSVVSTNLVPIGQGSSTVAVSLSTLLGGETIDLISAAPAASDTDTFMVGQGTNILTRQTFAAVWAYLQGKLPNYKFPVQEITSSKTIDATYNGQILVVTGLGVTLTPNYTLMGTGFECEIVTSGSGSVICGAGITASNASIGLTAANQYAKLIAFTSSAGNVVLASVGGTSSGGGSVAAPGPVTGLTLGTITSSSLAFSWSQPATGGAATYYQVQYRVYGSGATWTMLSPNPTATSAAITGLSASTQYDVQVAANNTGGVASSALDYGQSPVATTSAQTLAPSAYAPNVPSTATTGTVTSVSVALSWVAPGVDGSHSAASSYLVAYSSNGGSTFSTPVNVGNVTSYTFGGLTAFTAYVFEVAASNSVGASAYVTCSGTTSGVYSVTPVWASSNNDSNNLPPTTPISHTGSWPINGLNYTVSSGALIGSQTPWIVYSSSGTTAPQPTATSGPVSWQASSDGQTAGYGAYISPPASAGTWYVWAVVTATSTASSTIIGATASQAITVT